MSAGARSFAILTPEFPPGCGGIGDYVALLAERLAQGGDRVLVHTHRPTAPARIPGVEVVVLPDEFGPESRRMLEQAWRALPRDAVIFAQYVPQGFGWKGMNLPFVRFLGRRPERLWLMIHEIVYPFIPGQGIKLDLLASVTRVMLRLATEHAERAFFSTPAWEPLFLRYARQGVPSEWRPIPATASVDLGSTPPEHAVPTLAHFGSYGALVAEPLFELVLPLLHGHSTLELVLVGRGSDAFAAELGRRHPELAGRVRATGAAEPAQIARELAQAWVTIFPFQEGVTTRRTSLMTALAARSVVVTTREWCTESIWGQSGAVALVDGCRPEAMADSVRALLEALPRREELRRRGRALYDERFHVDRAIARLRALYDAPPPRA